jgi:drug/metabolite transporter (DMT)-like permease
MSRRRGVWLALLVTGLGAVMVALAAPHGQLSLVEEDVGVVLVVVAAILLMAPRRSRRRSFRH